MKFNFTWKIWILIIALILSLISVFSAQGLFQSGVLVHNVQQNSTALESGFVQGMIITGINGNEIKSVEDYSNALKGKFENGNEKVIFQTKDSEIIYFSDKVPEITVSELKKTNIRFGLDLVGGSRALVKPVEKQLSSSEAEELARVIENRLNVYGLEDIRVSQVSDLEGNNYVKVEIAGATPDELESLISEQGKFEARIGNETVFIGGDRDITSVSRSGQEALIEGCQEQAGQFFCNFRFTIYLSEKAAERHAEVTKDLDVNSTSGEYLSEKLNLYLDDRLFDSLFISKDLKGRVTTQISISGSGSGESRDKAIENAEEEMNKLQTVLVTGSLPYKLEIVKMDTISPVLGKQFLNSIMIAGLISLLAVALVVFFRYKKVNSSLALLLTSFSEVIIILGIASLIKWNIDLPSIAGILATIGTGIDQQIIVLDEARMKSSASVKQRLKRAFAIILGAYFTALVAMLPLLWAGAGLLKGFAITTIIGITAGVLITRPAFTDMIKSIEE